MLRSAWRPTAQGPSGLPTASRSTINGVRVSLHPAGHILGSAQVRVEHRRRGLGRLRRLQDRARSHLRRRSSRCAATRSSPSPPSACRSTAGPRRRTSSARSTPGGGPTRTAGKASLLFGYALGKAQRLLAGLDPGIGPILTHGAVERMTAVYRAAGVALPPTTHAGARRTARPTGRAPSSSRRPPRTARPGPAASAPQSTGFASGWMLIRGTRRRRSLDRGFAALGSRRLARPAGRDRRHRRRAGLGDPRIHRARGALAPRAGPRRAARCETRFEGERDDAADRRGRGGSAE